MQKQLLVGLVFAALLAVPGVSLAHGGHAHKAIGTVSSINGNNVMVKTTDGKTVMVMLDSKTKVTRGKTTLEAGALKVGDRIVAEGPEEKEMIMATSVKVGAATATAAKKDAAHPHTEAH